MDYLCPICGGNHDVLVISLENGGHVVTKPFPKDEAIRRVKTKASGIRARATRLDLIDSLWPMDGGEKLVD
jgi:hypothetical protein